MEKNKRQREKWQQEKDNNSEWYQNELKKMRVNIRKWTQRQHEQGLRKPLRYLDNEYLAYQPVADLVEACARIGVRSCKNGDCLTTNFARTRGGYSQIRVNGRLCYIAAIVLFANDQFPHGEQQSVSHLCGNNDCVEISHLRWETRSVNMERVYCQKRGACSHETKCLLKK